MRRRKIIRKARGTKDTKDPVCIGKNAGSFAQPPNKIVNPSHWHQLMEQWTAAVRPSPSVCKFASSVDVNVSKEVSQRGSELGNVALGVSGHASRSKQETKR